MVLRAYLCSLAAALGSPLVAFALDVTSVTAQQRWPWNDLVDVNIALSGASEDAEYHVSLAATCPSIAGEVACATLLTEPVVKGNGPHRIVWNAGADLPNFRSPGLALTAIVEPLTGTSPVYLVFDLSGGATATKYPHWYTTVPPDTSNDLCRTTQLWMRRCPAGTFTMGLASDLRRLADSYYYPPHTVELTKAFYLGVFELTQTQHFNIAGTWPSFFSNATCRATRPVEMVSFQLMRGNSDKTWYEAGSVTTSDSPLGKLRARTGFGTFDLPTEAQWEYACRAGTTDRFYLSEITLDNCANYGRSQTGWPDAASVTGDTLPDVGGTAKVGSYPANAWGFYDMYGNVGEICGDGNPHPNRQTTPDASAFVGTVTDPRGSSEEDWSTFTGARTWRGGRWNGIVEYMDNGYRNQVAGSQSGGACHNIGVRLCLTCE